MEKEAVTVNIKILGNMYDANLIKKALKLYLPVANKHESDSIESYLSLINYAISKAKAQNKSSQTV